MVLVEAASLTLSLPRVITWKFPLQPHQKYNITQSTEWSTWLFIAYSDERRLYYQLPLLHLIHFSLKGWENIRFQLGSEISNSCSLRDPNAMLQYPSCLRWCDRAFTRNCTAHKLSTSVVTKLLSFFLATSLGVFKADSRPQYSFNLSNFRSKKKMAPSGQAEIKLTLKCDWHYPQALREVAWTLNYKTGTRTGK